MGLHGMEHETIRLDKTGTPVTMHVFTFSLSKDIGKTLFLALGDPNSS